MGLHIVKLLHSCKLVQYLDRVSDRWMVRNAFLLSDAWEIQLRVIITTIEYTYI